MSENLRYVLPGGQRVPHERVDGADPMKLQDQFNEYGNSLSQILPLEVIEFWKLSRPQVACL